MISINVDMGRADLNNDITAWMCDTSEASYELSEIAEIENELLISSEYELANESN